METISVRSSALLLNSDLPSARLFHFLGLSRNSARRLYKRLSCKGEFHENLLSDSHALLKDADKFTQVFSIFLD